MKILFLSRWFPLPADNGSKIRVSSLVRTLAMHHDVTLLSFSDQASAQEGYLENQDLCQEIYVVHWKAFEPDSFRARLGFMSLTPRSLVDTFSSEMRQWIEGKLLSGNYDLVIASQLNMASYSPYFQGVPALFEEVELSIYYESFSKNTAMLPRARSYLSWLKLRCYLVRLMRNFNACTVVSIKEQQLLSMLILADQPTEIIPNCINLNEYQENNHLETIPYSLIFTGSFRYLPNYNAMNWFLGEIYPLVEAQLPEIKLTITGDHDDLPLPSRNNVNLTGYVDDIRSYIARSSISIVPIQEGGGTRLKILEAMALRTPVVTTTKGAEGLDAKQGQHLLIADTPAAFADSVCRLLADPSLQRQLATNAFRLVKERYDCASVLPDFLSLVERVAAS